MFKVIRNVMLFLLCFVAFLCSTDVAVSNFSFAMQTDRVSQVILGGETVGFEYTPCGVPVLSVNEEVNKVFQVGDIIKSICDEEIYSSQQISNLLNGKNRGRLVNITYYRNNEEFSINLTPAFDLLSQKYILGVWVKDDISGVGTLTYINPSTGYFGSLGHPITVGGQTKNLSVKSGKIYSCDIVSVVKGYKGRPGELKGVILKNKPIGKVVKNTDYGVFGTIDGAFCKDKTKYVDIGGRKTIKPGNAQIYSSVVGGEVKAYDIQIIKTNYQNVSNDKSLVFKVTDKELIAQTGGIVQGMSGSPIVQNGKLVGAVTHVFTNDSTKGFGIYIDWML